MLAADMSSFAKTEMGHDLVLTMQALKRIAQPDDIGDVIMLKASQRCPLDHGRRQQSGWRLKVRGLARSGTCNGRTIHCWVQFD
jgi:hypothetical protein